METTYLLPNRFKLIGWVLLFISTGMWIFYLIEDTAFKSLNYKVFAIAGAELFKETVYFSLIKVNLYVTISGVFFILGGLFVGFAKQKIEDEFIMKLRLLSFQWAILLNYSLLLLSFIFVYNVSFLSVMVYNMFTVLILFIIRFHYLLYKFNDATNEK